MIFAIARESPGALSACAVRMKIPPRHAGAKRPTSDEIKGLERALNKTYARLREQARAEWLRHHGGKPDAADAKVSVRITAESKPAPPVRPKNETAPRKLLPKPRASPVANSRGIKRADPASRGTLA